MDVFSDKCGRRRVKSVLCLYLLVVHVAAECSKPDDRENIILSNESLLMNDFPEGSDVTLVCGNGFVADSGSGLITCSDGKWTEPDLVCRRMDCGVPPGKPHMSFDLSQGTLFGARLKVLCDKGYQVSGSSYKRCYSTGWSGKATCEIVTCEKPTEVTNGRNSWVSQDNPKYEDSVQYDCDEGYSLVGRNVLVCGEDGEYDALPPECHSAASEETITTKFTPTATPATQTPGAAVEKTTTVKPTPTPTTQTPGAAAEKTTTVKPTPTPTTQTPGVKNILTTLLPTTAHRDKTVTNSEAPTVPASIQGGRDVKTAEDKAAATVTSVTPFRADEFGVDRSSDNRNTVIIVGISVALAVACIGAFVMYKLLLRKKGSYDTREDLKPELLQFQNL